MDLWTRLVATTLAVSVTSAIFTHMISVHQQQLRELAIKDPLTKTYNRLQMDLVLRKAVARRQREGRAVSLVALDIDHFKTVNDTYGHGAGDEVLKRVAGILLGRLRTVDTVFRTGGEEFLVLLEDAPLEEAAVVADELRELISASGPLAVTASLGVAELRPKEEMEQWLRRADERLYRAKKTGRNQVVRRPANTCLARANSLRLVVG